MFVLFILVWVLMAMFVVFVTLILDMADDHMFIDLVIQVIKFIALAFDTILYPLHILLQHSRRKKLITRQQKAKVVLKDDRTITFRSVENISEIHTRIVKDKIDTMEKVLIFTTKKFGNRKCLGTRKILSEEDEVQPKGKILKKYVMGEYQWLSFNDVNRLAENFGRGLREIGYQSHKNIAIFAETRAEWTIAAHGCFKQNIPLVTLYANLGEEGVIHGLNETEVTAVITSHDMLPKIKSALQRVPLITKIIYMEDQLHATDTDGFKPGIDIISFKQILAKGEVSVLEAIPPTTDDIAVIMYTSGTTGTPKGVLITHKNMDTSLRSFSDLPDIEDDIFIGFLPLAHIFELLIESVCLLYGVPIGYSTTLTMIDSSLKIKKGTKGDATVLRPTCMTAVPLVLDRIYKGVNEKLSIAGPFKQALFHFAFEYKRHWMGQGFSTPIIDRIVFNQTRKVLGGRMKMIFCGGAPLSPETHELVKVCLCEEVMQGYGLTETTSSATVMSLGDPTMGRVGGPTTLSDIRLENWEEGNYHVTDKPFPRGEIIVGGDNISLGYYKNPEKTKQDFFEEDGKRWFRTGDIGEIHDDGALKIIDRKKDLVKLQGGEYVSLGKVEAELKTCPLVDNICLFGDSTKNHTVALIVPDQKQLMSLAHTLGMRANVKFNTLCSDKEIEKAVLEQLTLHGTKCKLEKFEIPKSIKLCQEIWSPETGLVTAAFKLKRKSILKKYQNKIAHMYNIAPRTEY